MWKILSTFSTILSNLSKKKVLRSSFGFFSVAFFLFFVIIPSIYVVTYVPLNWHAISLTIFSNPENTKEVIDSLEVSIVLALLVASIDIIIGIPLAFYLVRGKGRVPQIMNTIIEIPIITPTSALGLSVALFWPAIAEGPISPFIILMLLHIAFTIPYMVRSVSAALTDFDISYEMASKTLGARSFTAIRTITLPLVKAGILTGTILSIARSLSETGATTIALTIINALGKVNTAPTLIYIWRSLSVNDPAYLYAGAFVSLLLILLSFVLFFSVKFFIRRFKLPLTKVYLPLETELSKKKWGNSKNIITCIFFVLIAFIPAIYSMFYGLGNIGILAEKFTLIGDSILYSLIVASIVTIIDLLLSIPLALFLARGNSRLKNIVDYLVEIPIVFPTIAVGISLNLFWVGLVSKSTGFNFSALVLIIFAHVAITFSFTVRTVADAMNTLDQSVEEAAKTLGATPFSTFFKVVFPQIKSSIFAGAIFAFTRSLDETGATLAVAPGAITASVLIVNLVNQNMLAEAGAAALMLTTISYIILLIIRKAGGKHGQS
ncbi:MAG: ABC transporter permease subunit [Nitrososphaeria archaeon]